MAKEKEQGLVVFTPQQMVADLRDGMLVASFDTTTREGKIKVFEALGGDGLSLDTAINKVLHIVDIVIEPIEREDDDGNTKAANKTILFCEEGMYAGVSSGIFNDVKRIVQLFGAPSTWVTPMAVEVKQIKVAKGSMFKLSIVD